jgi:hypothetical protein
LRDAYPLLHGEFPKIALSGVDLKRYRRTVEWLPLEHKTLRAVFF